jgi:hypothetical protein
MLFQLQESLAYSEMETWKQMVNRHLEGSDRRQFEPIIPVLKKWVKS